MNYPDGMTSADFAHIDADMPNELQNRAEELASAKASVIAAFGAFMQSAGDDLRKLIDAEARAFCPKHPDHDERDAFDHGMAGAPVNDWVDLIDLDLAEDYERAASEAKHAWESTYIKAVAAE